MNKYELNVFSKILWRIERFSPQVLLTGEGGLCLFGCQNVKGADQLCTETKDKQIRLPYSFWLAMTVNTFERYAQSQPNDNIQNYSGLYLLLKYSVN
jgi:hypothetical protein